MNVRSPAVVFSALFALVAACGHASSSSPPAAAAGGAAPSPAATRPSSAAPSQTPSSANPLVIIVMENHERGDVTGSAPFERSMLLRGRDYVRYYAVAHPSLPNYLAIASGSTDGKTTDDVTAGDVPGPTVWDQLTAAHLSWAVYEESMPSPCYAPYAAGTFPTDYALKHDPAIPFRSVFSDPSECSRVQPLSQMDPGHLPTVSFITPNECDDGHSCPLSTADEWLADHVPPLVQAGADVVVTYDEGTTDTGAHGSGGGHVFAAEIGPGVPAGSVVGTPVDHYSLLAGIEARYGLPTLGQANGATALPL